MWADAETRDWDNGEEFVFTMDKPFVSCIVNYVLSSAMMQYYIYIIINKAHTNVWAFNY